MRVECALRPVCQMAALMPNLPDQSLHDPLNNQFRGRNQIWKIGILGMQIRLSFFHDKALESGFPIDQSSDNISRARLFGFEDHHITIADIGTDHGFTAHFEGEGFGIATESEGMCIHRDAAIRLLFLLAGITRGNHAIDGDIDNFRSLQISRKNHRAGFVRVALNDTFFFQSAQVAHGCGLTGEAKMLLNVTRGRHDTVLPLIRVQILQQFALPVGERCGWRKHTESSVRANTHALMRECKCFSIGKKGALWKSAMIRPLRSLLPLLSIVTACALTGHGADTLPLPLNRAPVERTGTLPADTMILAQRAATAFGKKDWATARAAYREMIKTEPDNALAWANLGAVEQQAGRVSDAIECFNKSVQYNSQLAQSWNALGLLHSQKGDTFLAISMFTRAIHEDPADARAHNYLAIAAKTLGWADAAETELLRALELDPAYGLAHFNLALLYLDQKPPALELARRNYAKALSLGVGKDEIVERKLKE